MPFLRNAWYAAAWDDDLVGEAFLHRTLLDEGVLLVRDANGVPHALRDRCPHRFAPLHLGTRDGDVIACAYHGLRFGLDGRCVHNPHGDGLIPPNSTVGTYPIVLRHMLLWIWMGDPPSADPATIPDLIGLEPADYAINRGYMHVAANYEYMTDNIMDLGHIEFLHRGLLGSEAVSRADIDVSQEGDVVHSNRLTHNEILPDALEALFEMDGAPVDRWLDVTWYAPASMKLIVGVAPAGTTSRQGKESPSSHLMTPESESTTHYFWANSRDFRRDDAALHQALDEGLRYAFEQQDKPMILAQHSEVNGKDFWDLEPLILACDAGAVRARRILRKMIRAEQAA